MRPPVLATCRVDARQFLNEAHQLFAEYFVRAIRCHQHLPHLCKAVMALTPFFRLVVTFKDPSISHAMIPT
jgi:hypothetical protein